MVRRNTIFWSLDVVKLFHFSLMVFRVGGNTYSSQSLYLSTYITANQIHFTLCTSDCNQHYLNSRHIDTSFPFFLFLPSIPVISTLKRRCFLFVPYVKNMVACYKVCGCVYDRDFHKAMASLVGWIVTQFWKAILIMCISYVNLFLIWCEQWVCLLTAIMISTWSHLHEVREKETWGGLVRVVYVI